MSTTADWGNFQSLWQPLVTMSPSCDKDPYQAELDAFFNVNARERPRDPSAWVRISLSLEPRKQ
ncbi:hypothetical protein N7470_001557 [Penicillium chermesinum]|nr:hypothetical protein N7470_001557 [Penicillium chermesinum]